MFKKLSNLFKSNKGANAEMMSLIQQQAEMIAQLNAQLNAKATVNVPQEPVVNTNQSVVTNDQANIELDNYEDSINRNKFHQSRNFTKEFDKADWKDLTNNHQDYISAMLDEVRETIFTSLNPAFYADNLQQYRVELLQQYLQRLTIINGTYHPEFDNLDSLSKDEIISQIVEIETANWAERQTRKGKSTAPSAKQLELLKKNNVDTTNIKYWFQASMELEKIFGQYDNSPTNAQLALIEKLVKQLGLAGYDCTVKTKKEASTKIEELNKLVDEKFGAKAPTQAQKELYARYLKLNNKRLTKTLKDEMNKMSSREISKAINDLRNSYNSAHPELTEGQLNYLVSLSEQLMIPANRAELSKLTKEQATIKIDEMSRLLLLNKMKRQNKTVTLADINLLSKEEVKIKLAEFRPNREL
mgnify:FL=1